MNKKIILVSSMFFFINCAHHVIRENDKQIEDNPLSEKAKKSKIALIGFYPFKSYVSAQSGRRTTYTAILDYSNSTKSFFSYGKKIEDFSSSGVDPNVSEEKIKEFIGNYLEQVKKSGLDEIGKVVDLKEEGDKKKFLLRKRDVDFYIVGIHGPPFEGSSAAMVGKFFLTGFPFLLTLGLFPAWTDKNIESTFLVYDKNLNLIKKREFKNNYNIFISWWGKEEEGGLGTKAKPEFIPKLYKPDVIDFANEFAKSIN